uniref:Small ribosomal subunit protein uS3c n=1 Tax=Chlorella vulgaris TaxID=3077 RepID=RR3_CHLVU|nr:ribosomal protein S3 [Chlorella vulgaris]P56365.1 RecName: Full=Small ribosomal subunit protein uS3c; AltName: Full=30S ribosomal protein S3, chloroplastic [Chlorella vulgaris]BAA58006.1 30S ribosomal protein S3 [Chlorella vulgaris]
MGQKVHPIGFRLGITQKHRSYWCTTPQKSALWIQDASFLRNFIKKKYIGAGITHIEIQRQDVDSPSLGIQIYAARLRQIAGNDSKGLERLQEELVKQLQIFYRKRNLVEPGTIHLRLSVKPLRAPEAYAEVLAEKLVEELEQRKPFRRAMRQTVQRALRAGVKGIKVQISGRLNGADIARSEDVREGPVPLQTLRADIDYSSKPAKTIFGLLGIKIWVFRGERLTRISNVR